MKQSLMLCFNGGFLLQRNKYLSRHRLQGRLPYFPGCKSSSSACGNDYDRQNFLGAGTNPIFECPGPAVAHQVPLGRSLLLKHVVRSIHPPGPAYKKKGIPHGIPFMRQIRCRAERSLNLSVHRPALIPSGMAGPEEYFRSVIG